MASNDDVQADNVEPAAHKRVFMFISPLAKAEDVEVQVGRVLEELGITTFTKVATFVYGESDEAIFEEMRTSMLLSVEDILAADPEQKSKTVVMDKSDVPDILQRHYPQSPGSSEQTIGTLTAPSHHESLTSIAEDLKALNADVQVLTSNLESLVGNKVPREPIHRPSKDHEESTSKKAPRPSRRALQDIRSALWALYDSWSTEYEQFAAALPIIISGVLLGALTAGFLLTIWLLKKFFEYIMGSA